MTTKATIRTPVIPRNKADPTQSSRQVGQLYGEIDDRYLSIKRQIKQLFDQVLIGRESQQNIHHAFLVCNNEQGPASIYQVNVGKYIYDMSAPQLANVLERVQSILDDNLLEGGRQNVWPMSYVKAQYERGTLQAVSNLSVQSNLYSQQVSLAARLSSPGVQNQVASAAVSTYSDWKGISDKARADLSNVISDSIGRGVNPRETAAIVSKRLDVSMSSAKNIAQTEQVGALRDAQRTETLWARDKLGLKAALLHLSALKPTSRTWHVARHGHTYSPEEVEAWYAQKGNRYRCYCSQIPVILGEDGKIINTGMVERLAKERQDWLGIDFIDSPKIKIPKVPAKSATDVSSVEGWMRNNVSENVLLPPGTSLDAAKTVANTMSEAITRFNAPPVKMVGDLNLGGLGAYESSTKSIHIPAITLDEGTWTAIETGSAKQNYKAAALTKASSAVDSTSILPLLSAMDSLPYSAVQSVRGTVAHEVGHHVYYQNFDVLDNLAQEAKSKGWDLVLSDYANKNHRELFAEAFSLYIAGAAADRARIYPPLLLWLEENDVAKSK